MEPLTCEWLLLPYTSDDRLYLDDLHVGGRFTSRTHVVDGAFEPIWLCDERDKALIFKQGLCAAYARAGLTARVL